MNLNWQYLWLVLVIPLGVWLYLKLTDRFFDKALAQLGSLATLKGQLTQSATRIRLKTTLLIIALILITIAALRPSWGLSHEKVIRKGLDIVIALDISASMRSQDVLPNRLDKAVIEIKKMLTNIQNDRVGLVTFAGSASAVCPLTMDTDALNMFLQGIADYHESLAGTNIENAYQTSLTLFDFKSAQDKVLILVTDGENLKGNLDAVKSDSTQKGIIILPIAIGTAEGSPIPDLDRNGQSQGYKKDRQGNIIISRASPQNLATIASLGPYEINSTGQTLPNILDNLASAKRARLTETKINIRQNRYRYFLFPGLLLLLISYLIPEFKSPKRRFKFWLLIAIILPFLWPQTAHADIRHAAQIREANRAISTQQWDTANRIYQSLPNTPKIEFNKIYLDLASDQPTKAETVIEQLTKTPKIAAKLKAKALYNQGNFAFRAQQYDKAIKAYRQGLLWDSRNKALKYNLELANAAKTQQNAPKNQNKKDPNKDQNKDQNQKSKKDPKNNPKQGSKNKKNADKMLDAFEQQQLRNNILTNQKPEDKNVEKDW